MPKRSVYVDPTLDKEIKAHPEIPFSTVCQDAIREAIEDTRGDPVVVARRLIIRAERLLSKASKPKSKARARAIKKA